MLSKTRYYNEYYRSINRYLCSIQINKTRYTGSEEVRLMKEYTDKQINSMILHLRLNDIAEIYYLEQQDPITLAELDKGFYDYKTDSWLSRKMIISSAIKTGWKDKKEK